MCDNHCCKKPLEKDEGTACSLCRQATYCSNKCAVIDWPAHDCANVFDVDGTIQSQVIAMPYHFEDCMSEAQLDSIPATDAARQQILMRQVDDNLVAHSRLHKSLAQQIENGPFAQSAAPVRGTCPAQEGSYQLSLDVDGQECANVSGDLRRNTIYATNEINAVARKLGGGVVQAQSNRWTKPVSSNLSEHAAESYSTLHQNATIYWPNQHALSESSIPLQGEMRAQLSVQGAMPRTICADYNFSYWEPAGDAVQQHMTRKLQQKLGETNLPSNIASIRACAPNGDAIIITAQVDHDQAHVLDVEYIVPEHGAGNEWTNVQTQKYDPDPNDTAQMVGLAMAMQVAAHENDHLMPLAETIRLFAEQKERGEMEHVTPHIASAVTEAVNALHDLHIEAKRRSLWSRFRGGLRKKRSDMRVISQAKKIKKDPEMDKSEKAEKLNKIYARLIANAGEKQDSGSSGMSYLLQAEQVREIAEEYPEIVLKYDKNEYNMMMRRAERIQDAEKLAEKQAKEERRTRLKAQ